MLGEAKLIVKFVSILDWFLQPENSQHWAAVQKLAAQDSPASFETLKKYVLEANRFSGFLALIRVCVPAKGEAAQVKTDQGSMATLRMGEVVLCNLVSRSLFSRCIAQFQKLTSSVSYTYRRQHFVIRPSSPTRTNSSSTDPWTPIRTGAWARTGAPVAPLPLRPWRACSRFAPSSRICGERQGIRARSNMCPDRCRGSNSTFRMIGVGTSLLRGVSHLFEKLFPGLLVSRLIIV